MRSIHSTTEIEAALVWHPKAAEAAEVRATDDTTGKAVVAFVILRESAGDGGPDLIEELRNQVAKEIGPIAKPRSIMVVPELPRTRSGKITRRPCAMWPKTARWATQRFWPTQALWTARGMKNARNED